MKKALSVIGQFLLFLVVDAIGSLFYQPFHLQSALGGTPLAPRSFVWDGILQMLLVYAVVMAIHALRKRLATSAPWSTLALLLAALAGYLLRFGFVTRNW